MAQIRGILMKNKCVAHLTYKYDGIYIILQRYIFNEVHLQLLVSSINSAYYAERWSLFLEYQMLLVTMLKLLSRKKRKKRKKKSVHLGKATQGLFILSGISKLDILERWTTDSL